MPFYDLYGSKKISGAFKKLNALNLILFLFFSLFFSTFSKSQNIDLHLLKTVNAGNHSTWDNTMKGVSWSVYPAMVLESGGVLAYGYYKKDDAMIRNGYKSILCIGAANVISIGLKYAVNRTRPYTQYPNDITQRTETGPYSFPSGHTTAAFSTATALTLSTKKWWIGVPAFSYAGFVAYSRMRLGVHYPSDVLGGIFIGVGTGLLTWQLDKWMFGK
jgi:membrane-associated phospholipid phosphatase